ncbi:MAG: GGDEF domain-containing protein [Sporomusaceae bacterium]|nr:GGDEF domain-containing protein [Sporomusaceae bacterium]
MMRQLSHIMTVKFPYVDALAGLSQVQEFMLSTQLESLPVIENGKILGVIDYWDVLKTHPNRIAADAMSDYFKEVVPGTFVWEAKEAIDSHGIKLFIVKQQDQVVGIVSPSQVALEIGRQFDVLTELYKKDYIYYQAVKVLKERQLLSLIFLDVNNFGKIDKQYGHIAGDQILREIGQFLKAKMSKETHVSRFGGDEFLILTPYKLEKTRSFAEILLREVKEHRFYKEIPVSFSAGIVKGICHGFMKNSVPALERLVNCASLASTQAKKESMGLVVANQVELGY